MKYASWQDWALHAYADGRIGWWVVAKDGHRVAMLPGTVGFQRASGGYEKFEDCVSANRGLEPIEFQFPGGPLGVQLADSPYTDNLPGAGNSNPTWRFERIP